MMVTSEAPAHAAAIRAVHLSAFPTAAEADLVDWLREDGDVAVAHVAFDGANVIGHVVLSRMRAPFRALGLGPVAVRPDRQRQGVGHALITAALDQARREGWEAIFVLGDPAYYTRFGFSVEKAEGFSSPYAGRSFMVLGLKDSALPVPSGRVDYAPAFARLA